MTRKLFTKQVKTEGFPKGIVEKERHFSRGYTEDREDPRCIERPGTKSVWLGWKLLIGNSVI